MARVAVLSSTYLPSPPPSYGGLEYVAYLHALGLSELGHDVTLYAAPNPAARYPFRLAELPQAPEGSLDRSLLSDLESYDAVIDESHSHLWGGICIYHDYAPRLGERCEVHVAVSEHHAWALSSLYGVRFLYAYDPVDASWARPARKERLVVWYGRMNKGANEFLRLLRLWEVRADVAVVGDDSVAGEEDAREAARLAEALGAQYYGLVEDRREVGRILGRAAVVASAFHPLYREAFGMWAVEAIAAGALPLAPQESVREIARYAVREGRWEHYLLARYDTDYATLRSLLLEALGRAEAGERIVNERDAELFSYRRVAERFLSPILEGYLTSHSRVS